MKCVRMSHVASSVGRQGKAADEQQHKRPQEQRPQGQQSNNDINNNNNHHKNNNNNNNYNNSSSRSNKSNRDDDDDIANDGNSSVGTMAIVNVILRTPLRIFYFLRGLERIYGLSGGLLSFVLFMLVNVYKFSEFGEVP